MKKLLLPLLLIFALSGCSSKSPVEMAADVGEFAQSEAITTSACFEYLKVRDQQELALYEGMESADKERALSTRAMSKMVSDLTGKSQDLCKPGTNVWDATIAWAAENEKTKRQYSTDLKSVATFGIVTTGAVKLVDSLAGAVGDKISTTGDNSGVTKTTTNTTTTNTAVAADKSTATNNATAGSKEGETVATGKTPTAAQWADCTTVASGAASNSEINACLQRDYGINSSECNGGICIDGQPYNGPAVK
jgi:hypothetical protein